MGSFQMQRVRKEAEVRSTEGTEEQSSRVENVGSESTEVSKEKSRDSL